MRKDFCRGCLILALAFAANHDSRAALVLDDPLQGTTSGTRVGGTFVTGGWLVTGKDDCIFWHVPTLANGAVEWSVKGLAPNECRVGMEDKTELFHMYDYTWNNSDYNYVPGYRDNPFKHFVRKTGCLDTGRVNSMEILWLIGENYREGDSPVLSWDATRTYVFREEWGPDGAGNSTLRTYRDGVILLTQTVPGDYAPGGHSIRIAASTRRAADAGAPLGAIFSNVRVWDLSSRIPGAPTVTEPANNATLTSPLVFVQWAGDPHSSYQVRVTQVNKPDTAIVWESAEVGSDRNFTWTGPLPDLNTYHVFARLGENGGWGEWSTTGRTFRVDTTSLPAGPNVARLSGRSFRDNHGPFLALGASYFQALRKARHDRARLDSDLALLASKGFNYVRILSMVNWDGLEIAPVSFTNSAGHFVQGWPDYWQQFRDLLDLVARHGLRTEVTIFADAQYVMPSKSARQAHLDGILANLVDRERKVLHLEVANEAWQNGFPGSQGASDLREFAQYLADRTSVPVAITSNDDTSDAGIRSLYTGSAADLATVHFSRNTGTPEGGWFPVRDCYRAGNLPGVPPVSSNEPIGPGSSVSSENDPIKLCAAAVFAYLANLPAYVYHTRAGVYGYLNCCPPSEGEVPFESTAGINAYLFLRQILPPDLASWVRNDGLETRAPFTVFCDGQANRYWPDVNGATDGCDRNIGGANGREFVSFPMGILGGGVTLQARRPLRFQVFNPLTGAAVSNLTLTAGSRVTLPQGPGAWILKGGFLDTEPPMVPKAADWKYLDSGVNHGTAWRMLAFNDSAWAGGAAQLGYGEGDEATVVGFGPSDTNKHITTYFRHPFLAPDPSAFTALTLRLLRDDGAVVYLNGAEVFRSNMPTGVIGYTTFAASLVSDADETTFFVTNLSPALLVAGTNLLAVEVHQINRTSSDLSFDLELLGLGNSPPVVQLVHPQPLTTLGAPASVVLDAQAWDSDGTISRIEFFANDVKVGEDTAAPFSRLWSNIPPGDYLLTALATDDGGAVATSTPVTISVRELLVAASDPWKYLDTGANPGPAWHLPAFDDADWASGEAQLGYGDGDEATLLSYGPNAAGKYTTTWFRRAFTVPDPAVITNLTLRLLRDDGAIVYLNGVEIFRSNMPAGETTAATFAASAAAGAEETTYFTTTASPTLLVSGNNVLAVEVHQVNPTSTDLSFALELIAETPEPPPPRLNMARSRMRILLSWPVSPAGFWPQFTAHLAPLAAWSDLPQSTVTSNGLNWLTDRPVTVRGFYRLRRQ